MVDFALPLSAEEMGMALVDSNNEDRWYVTLARLNDPDAAKFIAPGIKGFPTPLVLTLIMVVHDYDPSTKLPTIVTEENREIFELADGFARKLTNTRTEKGQVAALEKLIHSVAYKAKDKDDWHSAYRHAYALILTLSENFEETHDRWTYFDEQERLSKAIEKFITCLGSILLNPPTEATKTIVTKEMSVLRGHLEAGSFVSFVDDEIFIEECPDAFSIWKDLIHQHTVEAVE